MNQYKEYQVGNYIFRFRADSFYTSKLAADEWAFYLQHNMPITEGLNQQLSNFQIPNPAHLIPTDKNE